LIVYVFVVTPSCAVTSTVITLSPTLSVIRPDGLPLATVTPLTLTVAVGSATVGVTVTVLLALVTLAVYESVPLANGGDNAPPENTRLARFALLLGGAPTVSVADAAGLFSAIGVETAPLESVNDPTVFPVTCWRRPEIDPLGAVMPVQD
jgi:hypothetical protein